MEIHVENRNGIRVVHLSGELIGQEDDGLVDMMSDLLAEPQAKIVLDLAGVSYLNSTGLSELVRVVAQANVQEARTVLASPSAYLAGVLEMTKLDRFFEICPSLEDALQRLS